MAQFAQGSMGGRQVVDHSGDGWKMQMDIDTSDETS